MVCLPMQMIDTGHYCLPVDSDIDFSPLSKQIEMEFLALVKPFTTPFQSEHRDKGSEGAVYAYTCMCLNM